MGTGRVWAQKCHLCNLYCHTHLDKSVSRSLLSYTIRYVSLTELVTLCQFGFRVPIQLCSYVREEGGDGEGFRVPMYLCACVREEGGDGEGVGEGGDSSNVL